REVGLPSVPTGRWRASGFHRRFPVAKRRLRGLGLKQCSLALAQPNLAHVWGRDVRPSYAVWQHAFVHPSPFAWGKADVLATSFPAGRRPPARSFTPPARRPLHPFGVWAPPPPLWVSLPHPSRVPPPPPRRLARPCFPACPPPPRRAGTGCRCLPASVVPLAH